MGVHRPPKSSSSSDAKLFPPGFRFHPTDEELVLYYLKRKICRRKLKPDIIAETDVYKWDPDDLPDLSKLKTGDRQWFFLSPRDRRYPNGGRSNRATMNGYWKATGKDRAITCNSRSVGFKKTLVYYKGRAPSGERTDWVMHEYTLDEEELKRCPAQDYYVLYKLYKKSGPGPKNGEEYGAPFKEEDWADDECVGFSGFLDQDNIVKEADNSCIDYNKAKNLPQGQVDDIDVFLQKIADDAVFVPPLGIGHSYTFDEVFTEKENGSTCLPDQNMVPYHYPQSDVRGNFDNTSPPASGLPIEASEMVPNARKDCEQEFSELFSEDFLEIDDLLGPQPSVQQFEEPLSTTGINGFTEANMYNDAAMVIHDMGQDEPHPRQGLVSRSYLTSNPDCGMTKVQSQSYLNTVGNEGMSYHHQLFHNEENMMSSQLWAPEPSFNLQTPEANCTAAQPNYGVLCNGEGSSLPTGAIQKQICPVDDDTASWLSATLWSFVEAIPTTPASASENALVNKAFERMSSFSRLKTKNAAGRPTTSRRVQKFVGGMFSFSVIGIVCAILLVLIGTSVKLLGKYISS